MSNEPPPSFVTEELERLGLDPGGAVLERLARFAHLLVEGNRRMNLTGPCELEELWRRHLLDSLGLVPHLKNEPGGQLLIDVGSGAGLPGIPLAMARPDLSFTLLEATTKKARFLEETVADLGLTNVTVLNQRAETAGKARRSRERYDIALARAVGPLAVLAELTLPLLQVGGKLLALKGRSGPNEFAPARKALELLGGGPPGKTPIGTGGGFLVRVEKIRPTPPRYPRPPGHAKAQPL